MRIVKVLGAAALLASIAVTADAATCSSSATFTLGSATSASCFSSNDSNQINASFDMFGMTGWTLADKNDDRTTGSPFTFTNGPFNETKSGSWEVSDWGGYATGDVVITLKAGKGFGAFLIDTDYTVGTWAASKDLSHASIYYRNITPVPLPAGIVLLLTAVAGFGFVRNRA